MEVTSDCKPAIDFFSAVIASVQNYLKFIVSEESNRQFPSTPPSGVEGNQLEINLVAEEKK